MSSLMSDALQCAIRLTSKKFAPVTSATLFRQNQYVKSRVLKGRANGFALAPEQANTRGADLNLRAVKSATRKGKHNE